MQAGLTITLKPVNWLQVGMLAAAAGSYSKTRPLAVTHQRFALASLPPAQPAAPKPQETANKPGSVGSGATSSTTAPLQAGAGEASGAAAGEGAACQLAVWDGRDVVICDCFPGLDPSRWSIDQTITPKMHKLYFDRDLEEEQQQQQQAADRGACAAATTLAGKRLSRGASGVQEAVTDGAVVVRISVHSAPGTMTAGPKGEQGVGGEGDPSGGAALAASEGTEVEGGVAVQVVVNPATQLAASGLHAAAASAGEGGGQAGLAAASGLGGGQQDGSGGVAAGASASALLKVLSAADTAFLNGGWEECEATCRRLLPLSCGQLLSVGNSCNAAPWMAGCLNICMHACLLLLAHTCMRCVCLCLYVHLLFFCPCPYRPISCPGQACRGMHYRGTNQACTHVWPPNFFTRLAASALQVQRG